VTWLGDALRREFAQLTFHLLSHISGLSRFTKKERSSRLDLTKPGVGVVRATGPTPPNLVVATGQIPTISAPPLTGIVCPVMKPAASETRNAITSATSSG